MREVVERAVPADNDVQAFVLHHLVPAQQLLAVVTGSGRGRQPFTIAGPKLMILKTGGTSQITVSPPLPATGAEMQFELQDPPDGIQIVGTSPVGNGTAIHLWPTSRDEARLERQPHRRSVRGADTAAQPNKPAPKKARWSIGFLPAIPFETVPGPTATGTQAR